MAKRKAKKKPAKRKQAKKSAKRRPAKKSKKAAKKASAPQKPARRKKRKSNAKFVDGFVIPMPKKNVKDYQKIARKAGKIWMEHGALEYREAVGTDMRTQMGVPFPRLAKAKKGETVVFAWIVYNNRQHRNEVNKAVMKDKRIHKICKPEDMPFNVKRMTYGGFEALVDFA